MEELLLQTFDARCWLVNVWKINIQLTDVELWPIVARL